MLCFYAYFWSKRRKWISPVLCIVEEIGFEDKLAFAENSIWGQNYYADLLKITAPVLLVSVHF
jgi:hypothetical protein